MQLTNDSAIRSTLVSVWQGSFAKHACSSMLRTARSGASARSFPISHRYLECISLRRSRQGLGSESAANQRNETEAPLEASPGKLATAASRDIAQGRLGAAASCNNVFLLTALKSTWAIAVSKVGQIVAKDSLDCTRRGASLTPCLPDLFDKNACRSAEPTLRTTDVALMHAVPA